MVQMATSGTFQLLADYYINFQKHLGQRDTSDPQTLLDRRMLRQYGGFWGMVMFSAEFYIMVQIAILGFAVLLNRSKLNY